MATTINWKDLIDKTDWRPLAPAITAATTAGRSLVCDLRNSKYKNPYIWYYSTATYFEKYLKEADDWIYSRTFTAVGGTMGAGSAAVFVPSHGIFGVPPSTGTTTSITLATLSNVAHLNSFANSGNGTGYQIRIIDKASGKIETRVIIANTAGANPICYLNSPLSFTPTTANTTYEMLAGRIYILGAGITAAGYWKAFDVATESISGNLSVVNLAATIGTDTQIIALDEQYVPHDRSPGEGFLGTSVYDGDLKCLTATASLGLILTGQAANGDASVLANEYRNFQIRIVEDTTNPTAVGQRRRIASHTAGPSAEYTIATAWTAQPSASAKFVIELNNDILLWTGAHASGYTYAYAGGGFAADANWSVSSAGGTGGANQYTASGYLMGIAGGMVVSCFSITPDVAKSVRHSHIIYWRGGGSADILQLDIAGAGTYSGTWTNPSFIGYSGNTTFGTGSYGCHEPTTIGGRYFYIHWSGFTQRVYRFDLLNRVVEPFSYLRFSQGAVSVGNKMAHGTFIDGSTKIGLIYLLRTGGTEFFDIPCLR